MPDDSVKQEREDRCREIHEDTPESKHHSAGRRQDNEAEVDDLEKDDAEDGLHFSGADDIRLRQADLPDPGADMERIGGADEDVDQRKIRARSRDKNATAARPT